MVGKVYVVVIATFLILSSVAVTFAGYYAEEREIPPPPPPPPPPPLPPSPPSLITPTPTPTPMQKLPELKISHTSTKVKPEVGAEAIVTATIANVGEGVAKDIYLTESLPSSIACSYASGATSFSPSLVMWSGELKPGEMHSIKHTIKILEVRDLSFTTDVTCKDDYGKKYEYSTIITIETLPTPIPTPTPGFEVVFAIAGLSVMAYLVRRKNL
jgi:PGF-CTERM protein